jgi:hypothetical protein
MKLIDNWKEAYRFISVQANVVGTAMLTTYVSMYDKLKDTIDPKLMATVTIAVFVIGTIGRITNQGLDK